MNTGTGENHLTGPPGLQRHDLGGLLWLHTAVPAPKVFASIDVGTPIPAAVIDILCAPPPRPQRTVVHGWTAWTLRPVAFQPASALVDAADLVIAVGPAAVITGGQLPNATPQHLLEQQRGTTVAPASAGDAVTATILSDLLDDVGRVIADLDDAVEDIETAVFAPGRASHAARIYRLKREVQTVRRCIGPLPELLAAEQLRDAVAGTTHLDRYAAVLPARARRLVEQLTHADELLDGVLTAHLAQVAIQQNDDMRRISAWVAIVAAPTAIASIYGMNFRFMPELGWRFGYPLVMVAMLAVCVVLYRLFRRSGWL